MLRSRDFYLMKVYNLNGKYLGVINDIRIDFHNGKVLGFTFSRFSLYKKKSYFLYKDIYSMNKSIVVKKIEEVEDGISFHDLKYIEVKNQNSCLIGVLEDILIHNNNFRIKGLIVSPSIIEKISKGKDIILIRKCKLYDDFILYSENKNVKFKSIPHILGEL